MASYVAVVGSGSRAVGWATRLLASALDVVVDDPTVPDAVASSWPMAQRLGLFPGARLDRLSVSSDPAVLAGARLVQVVGAAQAPAGAVLVATDHTAFAHEPIHLLPLVELADAPGRELLAQFYRAIGMAPCGPEVADAPRRRLGPAIADLADHDPEAMLAVMRALRPSGIGAGKSIADHETARFASTAAPAWCRGAHVAAPLQLYRTPVESEWVDYNGHMTEAAYLTAAGWASDALFRYVGDDEAYRAAGHSFYTVETHVHYLREVEVHEPLRFDTQILGVDAKRVHLVHQMFHDLSGALLCSIEQMLVHVHMATARSVPILPHVADALAAICAAHADLAIPAHVGTTMRLPRPRS